MSADNPYRRQPEKAFWRTAVAQRHFSEMSDLSKSISLTPRDKIATAGSCFAQHIGRALKERGANFLDMEPAPAFLSRDEATEHGFGIYSCRYGNIYTVRQLLQLAREATGRFTPSEIVWEKNGRYFDAMRPSVDPAGHANETTVIELRKLHLANVRRMLEELDVLVFTLGLTEGWTDADGGTVFATCPGTTAGTYKEEKYRFKNFIHSEILDDFRSFHEILLEVNPSARVLLTVSPVSLAATATDDHVLVANTYSKATLRSVAGELSKSLREVYYFPSFEIITNHVNRGSFYDPDMRSVNRFGVNHVMEHFFKALPSGFEGSSREKSVPEAEAIICDEEKLGNFQTQS
ncbi:GSCFA domain-containing protein [Thioclava sp. FR2]|uniref:GSCFA domain-containing protein n=1 Tax=Thioclava sp. FR2 TaxID=3445780 RepID=UPI003EB8B758